MTVRRPPATEATPALRTTAATGAAMVLALLPMFLVGSLASFLREDLEFDHAELGVTVAAFFAASAVSSLPGGQLAERAGARVALLTGSVTSGSALLIIAVGVSSWLQLTLALGVAGLGNGAIQPACNLALMNGVPAGHQGLAFGTKQSAAPVATLLAGGAVPGVAVLWDWRWAFAAAAVIVPITWLLLPKLRPSAGGSVSWPSSGQRSTTTPTLLLLAAAAGLGAAAAATLGAFLTDTVVLREHPPATAGVVLMVGSVAGVVVRLAAGWAVDRLTTSSFLPVGLLLALGSLGFGAIGVGWSLPPLVLGAILAFGAGWGWPGIFHFTVARRNPAAPAASTSVPLIGVYLGGVAGPVLFGAVAEGLSLQLAWLGTAAAALLSAALMVVSNRRS